MSLQGNLKDIDVPNVIDLALQMGTPVAIHLHLPAGDNGLIFVEDNSVVHASWQDDEGTAALVRLFPFREGTFSLAIGEKAPKHTITGAWNAVLLEILQNIDDGQGQSTASTQRENTATPEPLTEKLQTLLEDSDFQGAAVVGRDGLIYSARLPMTDIDEDLVGAVAASIFALSDRSVSQLKRGKLTRTFIQGSEGNIVVTFIDDGALFVGLAAPDVNLGILFAEARMIASRLAEIMASH